MALTLWSKLEDAGDVTSPDTGTGGAEIGSPTYVAAKFNNGILSDIDNEGCTFPTSNNSINLDKGTIEFWAKLNFETNDADAHYLISFLDISNGGIALRFNASEDDFEIFVYSEGGVKIWPSPKTVGLSWSSGDLVHFGLTWDRTGADIGSSKTIALYVNDSEEASSTTTWNTDTVNANLFIGIDRLERYHSDAVIDNLKVYDTCKVDFSDKETEGVAAPSAEDAIFFAHNF